MKNKNQNKNFSTCTFWKTKRAANVHSPRRNRQFSPATFPDQLADEAFSPRWTRRKNYDFFFMRSAKIAGNQDGEDELVEAAVIAVVVAAERESKP